MNENWRKRHNKVLMQLVRDLDVLSFVRISRLNWISHVNRMGSKRQVSQVFGNNPQDDQNPDGGIEYKQILINRKLQIGKRGQKQN